MLVRLVFSGGAPLMQPIGFVEAGFHIAAWLLLALFVAARASKRDASAVRTRLGDAAWRGRARRRAR